MRTLLSFHYYRDTDLDKLVAAFPTRPQVFADSGAFSAMSVGADVQLDEYVGWLRRWEHLIDTYVSLDVIRDPDATAANQARMEDEGLRPVPVFHTGSPWSELERLCEAYPYVALGGMVGAGSATVVLRWCVQAFRIARQTGTVFHGFGQTTLKVLRDLPWYSVDSSAWGAGHRYGTLSLWDESHGGRWVRVTVGDRAGIYRHAELIRAHGGDPAVLATPGCALGAGKTTEQYRAERAMVIGVCVVAWVRLEAWLRKRHGPVTFPEARASGPLVYLADARGGADGMVIAPDLAIAERQAGPLVYLADTNAALVAPDRADLVVAERDAGPMIYLADVGAGGRILAPAAHTLDSQPKEPPQ